LIGLFSAAKPTEKAAQSSDSTRVVRKRFISVSRIKMCRRREINPWKESRREHEMYRVRNRKSNADGKASVAALEAVSYGF
jgi:hypothetical protein